MSDPGQGVPSRSRLQSRFRLWNPPPQLRLHSPQLPHGAQWLVDADEGSAEMKGEKEEEEEEEQGEVIEEEEDEMKEEGEEEREGVELAKEKKHQ